MPPLNRRQRFVRVPRPLNLSALFVLVPRGILKRNLDCRNATTIELGFAGDVATLVLGKFSRPPLDIFVMLNLQLLEEACFELIYSLLQIGVHATFLHLECKSSKSSNALWLP